MDKTSNKWFVTIILKNGENIKGIIETSHNIDTPLLAYETIMHNGGGELVIHTYNNRGWGITFAHRFDVSAIRIAAYKEDEANVFD